MNELQTAYALRKVLDHGSEHLSYRISERLAKARQLALDEMPTQSHLSRSAGLSARRLDSPAFMTKLAIMVAPIVVVAVGIVTIAQWRTEFQAEALAELDAEVILDEVPINGYADQGFGVFLTNTRQ